MNAQVEAADFQTGALVKEGQKLVTFDVKDLEEQNQKAERTVRANQLGYQDSVNTSNEAAVKQAQARSQADSLQAQVNAKKQEIENLKAEISGEAQSQAKARKQEQEELGNQLKALQKELKNAQKKLEKSKTEYEKAQVEQQTAQVNFEAAAAGGNPQELEQAAHSYELPRPVRTVVTVCGAMRGVGGIDSWLTDVEEAYHISGEKDIRFQVRFRWECVDGE